MKSLLCCGLTGCLIFPALVLGQRLAISLTPDQMYEQYQTDPMFLDKYRGTVIEVTGVIATATAGGQNLVRLKTSASSGILAHQVLCVVPAADKMSLAPLRPDMPVKITGTFARFNMTFGGALDPCQVQVAGTGPATQGAPAQRAPAQTAPAQVPPASGRDQQIADAEKQLADAEKQLAALERQLAAARQNSAGATRAPAANSPADPPLGDYAVYQLVFPNFAYQYRFALLDGGRYNVIDKTPGTYTYDPRTKILTFESGGLKGFIGLYYTQGRNAEGPTICLSHDGRQPDLQGPRTQGYQYAYSRPNGIKK
jgi:hypothetical protein